MAFKKGRTVAKPHESEDEATSDSDSETIASEDETVDEAHGQPFTPVATADRKFKPAVLESLSSVESDVDSARSRFWMKYEEIASDFDKQFAGRLENGVDISMLFAGLFSAVNTAFIIAFQANVVAVNSSNAAIANIVNTGGLVSLVAWTTVLSYASLSASLLAAFGTLLAKQWLAYFKATRSTHGSLSSRGIHRQRKFDAIQNSHFNTILEYIPLLLQASLLLFAISLLGITWRPYRDVAGVILAATGIGSVLYLATFFSAMFSSDSPFQTLPSQLLRRVLKPLLHSRRRQRARSPRDLGASGSNTKFISLSISTRSREAPAVRWLLRISTDPVVVAAVAKMVPEVNWPLDFDVSGFTSPLWVTFKSCFKVQSNDYDVVSLSCSDIDQAYTCGKALCHLYSEILFGRNRPDQELRTILVSVAWCLSSTKGLSGPQEHGFTFICALISIITTRGSASTTSINVPEKELSWVLHIISAFLYSRNDERQAWLELAASISPNPTQLKSMSLKVLADHWVIIALGIDIPIHPCNLVKIDKSLAIQRLREEVRRFFKAGSLRLANAIQTRNTSVIPSALDLTLRVLSVEQERGIIPEDYMRKWIAGLYESSSRDVRRNGDPTIMEILLETLDHTPSPMGSFQGRGRYTVRHVLEDAVASNDVEKVGRVISLWLNDPQEKVDFNLCIDAITLLLRCDSPRFCLIALHSFTQILGLARSASHSVDFLQCDEGKLTRLFNTLLDPPRIDEDRVNVALTYVRVISTMADYASFHDYLLTYGHVQRCIDIRLGIPALAPATAETLQREHSFLASSVVASIGTCSDHSCIEAGVRPRTAVVKDYPLGWPMIVCALQYIQHALRSQLDANRITRIANYLEPIFQAPQAIPIGLREAIAARIQRTNPSALDSALVRLIYVLDSADMTPAPSERSPFAL